MSLHPKITDSMSEIDCAREIARCAVWGVLYHELELQSAHKKAALVKTAVARGNYEGLEINKVTENEEDDEPEDIMGVMRELIAGSLSSVGFHERYLQSAHLELAAITSLVKRAYPEINLDEIRTQEAAKLTADKS